MHKTVATEMFRFLQQSGTRAAATTYSDHMKDAQFIRSDSGGAVQGRHVRQTYIAVDNT